MEYLTVLVIMILICNIWVSRDHSSRYVQDAKTLGTIKSQLWVSEKS